MTPPGTRVLVTGSTSGIGEAIARRFASEGAHVVVTGRNEERGRAVVEALKLLGSSGSSFIAADLATLEGPAALAIAAEETLGGVDVLVNNAGIYFVDREPITAERFDGMFAVNVRAPHLLFTTLLPRMVERGHGVVVNITSPSAYRGYPGIAAHAASKAALDTLTKCWAAEYGQSGIRIVAVSPGGVVDTDKDVPPAVLGGTGIVAGRPGTGEDISAAVAFVSGPDAGYVHGTTLHVDGGMAGIGSLWETTE